MFRKNPEIYLAGLNLYPIKKYMIGIMASRIFKEYPNSKLAGAIAVDFQSQEPGNPQKMNHLIKNTNARLWAVFPASQPLLMQSGETIIYATLDEVKFPQEQTVYFKRENENNFGPDMEEVENLQPLALKDTFSKN